ncbi:CubicO group peptidase (beta-lactamase class C family) [Catenulispora sp. MAP12-49]|uniref:serine hydrolase domain-containing protein n=1 Tax=Catenulispora sp. MAP12-49 TaxID=3156302 RepID=UPI003518FAE0
MVSDLQGLVQSAVDNGSVPGAVALVARGDAVEVAAAGTAELGGRTPMARDSIFRIASLTKSVASALALLLIEQGRIGHDDPIATWLPELAHPKVARTPDAPLDDVVPARRPITVADLLTSRAGWGFPDDFTWPAIGALFDKGSQQHGRDPQLVPAPDQWLKNLAEVPMVFQPGERWLYNTCSDILGALMARATDTPLPELMAELVFEPLGMTDTGFAVPAEQIARFTSGYAPGEHGLDLVDPREGQWSTLPAFPSGAGGLVSTVDDYHAFARTLLPGATGLLSEQSVREMTTDHLTAEQRAASRLFLEGQGWGSGGSVDIAPVEPWNVVGRYGWTGGTGTTAHVIPATGTVAVLMTQVAMTSPTPVPLQRDFWTYAARR